MASRIPQADHCDTVRPVLRQRPEMASLKLLVLKFVQQYIAQWQGSPSLGEIASALATNRTRVRRAVRRLELDGSLVRVPGPRGLSLPDDEPVALRQLRARGWTINADDRTATPPAASPSKGQISVTNQPLLPPAELDYVPRSAKLRGIDKHGGESGREGGGAQKRSEQERR